MALSVVSGVGKFSLGSQIARELAARHPSSFVIGIDREQHESTDGNLRFVQFDLDPLVLARPMADWSDALSQIIRSTSLRLGVKRPITNVVLSAGRYFVGPFLQHPLDIRRSIWGVNVVGKAELLHTVMQFNHAAGADNAAELTVVDIGSSHALAGTPYRSAYIASKRFGLSLCESLHSGAEVANVIHIAPAVVDTPMLHWNHWVLKEGGDPGFWTYVLEKRTRLYQAIFDDCDPNAFEEAATLYGDQSGALRKTLQRYEERRENQRTSPEGIIDVDMLAKRIVGIMGGVNARRSGVYKIVSPGGTLVEDYCAFHTGQYHRATC